MRNRWQGLVPLVMGAIVLQQFSQHPNVQALRGVEMLVLISSGALFAVAVLLLLGLAGPSRTRGGA